MCNLLPLDPSVVLATHKPSSPAQSVRLEKQLRAAGWGSVGGGDLGRQGEREGGREGGLERAGLACCSRPGWKEPGWLEICPPWLGRVGCSRSGWKKPGWLEIFHPGSNELSFNTDVVFTR